ncbi:hypothetical protein [Streptomyces mirabilis]|uniref:hypothetical protein n=1 Tax=Streptomyces mirabilis TaxID=68239 RepID=UPI00332997E9
MSVKTLPLTVESFEPVPRSRPDAPRWAKTSSLNAMRCPWAKETLPGILVQDAKGQVPPSTYWHRPWVAQPFSPVMV